jgi:peroxiredoxin
VSGLALTARLILALVFAAAGVAKLWDRPGSKSALEEFGVGPKVADKGSVALPLSELAIAVGLLVPGTAWWSALAATGLLAAFIAAIAVNVLRGQEPECHCFGQLHSSPAGWRTLARNTVLLVLSVIIVGAGRSEMTNHVGVLGSLSTAGLALGLLIAGLAGVAGVQGFFLIQLLRQNGRIMSRLDRLETEGGVGAPETTEGDEATEGLPVGSPAPDFALRSIRGERVTLSELLSEGRHALLVFSDPDCTACTSMLPDLASWQSEQSSPEVAIISSGDTMQNAAKTEEHGLRTVLLQQARETARAYLSHSTPSAVAVSPDGKIASRLALGPAAIRALKERAEASPSSPNATVPMPHTWRPQMTSGLSIGTKAPDLEWRDLTGEPISLHGLQGGPVILIFWDPACNFCRRLAPEIRSWQQAGVAQSTVLVLVSRGAAEAATELDLPIVLDEDSAAGSVFGIRGTPSAVALDPQGRVASLAAIGGQAVMKLLESQSASEVPG